MDNFKISSRNVFDERFKKFANSRRAAKLQTKFKDRTFDERTKKIALVFLIVSFACTAFSAFSEHFYLKELFLPMVANYIGLAWLFVLVVIGLVEYGKREVIPQVWKNAFQYKSFDAINLFIALALSGASIFLSFEGAKIMPEQLAATPTLVSIDSLNSQYTAMITAKQNEAVAYFEANNWKGRLDGSSRPTYNKLLDDKSGLEKEHKAAINEAKVTNENILSEHEATLKKQGINIGYVTLVCEVLLFLLIGFGEYRDFRALSQFAHIENHNSNEVNVTTVETSNGERKEDEKPNHDTSNRVVIKGFQKQQNKAPNGERLTVNVKKTKECKQCGKEFTYKHWNKQYCSDACRVAAWELRTGKKLRKTKKV